MPRKQIDWSRSWRIALPFVLASAGAAFLPTILNLAVRGKAAPLREVFHWFPPNLLISTCIGGLAWLVLPRWAPYIASRKFPRNAVLLVAVLLAVAACGLLLAFGILSALGFFAGRFWAAYLDALRLACLITLMIGTGIFLYESFKSRMKASARELEAKQQEAERARQTAVEARLASLESRVHPHFLFNTLNSISALIREDPAQAEQLVERLASLLRFSLNSNQRSLTTLRRELKIVVDYLEIERARFGDRLRYTVDIPESLRDAEVPPMSIQTLVENCVKHAISPRREGGQIEVTAHESADRIEITVRDDGPGFQETGFAEGHGLDTLQARLSAQFGDRSQLTVARRDGWTIVSVAIPAKAATT